MASVTWKHWSELCFLEARGGKRICDVSTLQRFDATLQRSDATLQRPAEPDQVPIVPVQLSQETVCETLSEPAQVPLAPAQVQSSERGQSLLGVLPDPIVMSSAPLAPEDKLEDVLSLSSLSDFDDSWDIFLSNKSECEPLRLSIVGHDNADDDLGLESIRTSIKCDREHGVVTYYQEGFKMLSADGFSLQEAFPIKLTWLEEKLFGVITKTFAGYPNFPFEIKFLIPKPLKEDKDSADAFAILLFYIIRDKFRKHVHLHHFVLPNFVEVSEELVNSYKNVQFIQYVKMYAYIIFDRFLQLAASMEMCP